MLRCFRHYNDVRMSAMASQITSLTIVYASVYSGTDQRKHQSSTSLAFVRRIHRWPVNSLHKGPITRKMFLSDDVIMYNALLISRSIFAPKNSEKTPGELWGESCEFIVSTKFKISSILIVFNIVLYSTAIHRELIIQSSAVIMRSNIVRYFINNYRNWGRISIRCCSPKRHNIPRHNGRAMGCLLWIFCRYLFYLSWWIISKGFPNMPRLPPS